ncbi:MAG: thioredoxin [Candidatus Marinimicrobia bacterium CG1_02_48_14]|nr:MAG: thioredoxin [Candidatus Marinimicrobia bacterium CG1_02_48_14]
MMLLFRGKIVTATTIVGCIMASACSTNQEKTDTHESVVTSTAKTDSAQVTFIELGSVNCIPCKQMQPVMRAIEDKYGSQVKIIFYDVWQTDQKHYAQQYGIRLIPTQVFLDENGQEFFRHEGFFPETEIDQLLSDRELKPLNSSL